MLVLALLLAIAGTAQGQSVWDDLSNRTTLAENWGGVRNHAKEKGFTLNASVTQLAQGVVSGGKSGRWEYGGRANVTANLDTQKMGLWPGGFFTVEFESGWEDSVNGRTGALSPAGANQLFPIPNDNSIALPQVSFAQFFSPYAGVLIGKLDTTSGDANYFAHGKGDEEFLNLALNFNLVALVIPYSTLGAGLIVLPTKDPESAIVNFMVLQATGSPTQAGFDDISSDNLVFAAEGRVRTNFFGLTGHQLVGGLYSNASYAAVDQRLAFLIERRLVRERDTWAVYYNFDHFLYETDKSAGRGFGVFGRFGASKGSPIPVQYFASAGLGARGPFASRPHDRAGVGFYFTDVNSPTLEGPFVTRTFLDNEWGFELYYNFAITPWLLLTPDIQIIEPSQREQVVSVTRRDDIDPAVVLGTRLQLLF